MPIPTPLISEGLDLLHALASTTLQDYFRRLTIAQSFIDALHLGRTEVQVRELFLNEIASPAVQQLAAAGATDAAASLLDSISSLRITRFGPRLGNDPTAAPLLSDLHATLASYIR